ncbi:MAG: transcription antitermination factor NusB, partial [Planctomycetaceae bacterium]
MAHRRSRARQVCLQMLYQQDLNPDVGADAVREMMREQLEDEDLHRFCWRLFMGVMEWRQALDARI